MSKMKVYKADMHIWAMAHSCVQLFKVNVLIEYLTEYRFSGQGIYLPGHS